MSSFTIKIPNSHANIGVNTPVFIVAEIGKNFIQTKKDRPVREYLRNAKELVVLARKSGADAVKFQTHNVEDEQLNLKIRAPHFSGDRYKWVSRNTKATPINEFWRPLKDFCDKEKIIFFSTPCSLGAAKVLNDIGVELWKVASWDILDFVMLDYLRKSGKPIIISGGASALEDIDKSVGYIKEKNRNLALLHCVSKYPCPPEELNLGTISLFRQRYDLPIGFSDHSLGIESAIAAVALGARIIEKHFSLSRDFWGADHRFSMTPASFGRMSAKIREVEKSLEHSGKTIREEERKMKAVFAKGLFASRDIPAGAIITASMINAMRPGRLAGGLEPHRFHEIVGKRATRDFKKHEAITKEIIN